jgi:hypothetical protein
MNCVRLYFRQFFLFDYEFYLHVNVVVYLLIGCNKELNIIYVATLFYSYLFFGKYGEKWMNWSGQTQMRLPAGTRSKWTVESKIRLRADALTIAWVLDQAFKPGHMLDPTTGVWLRPHPHLFMHPLLLFLAKMYPPPCAKKTISIRRRHGSDRGGAVDNQGDPCPHLTAKGHAYSGLVRFLMKWCRDKGQLGGWVGRRPARSYAVVQPASWRFW